MGYGESFKRVLISAAVIISTAMLLYQWFGVKPINSDSTLTYPPVNLEAPRQFATAVIDTQLTSGVF
jgi:hypothetical protein